MSTIFLMLAVVSFEYKQKLSQNEKWLRQYEQGLQPVNNKDNPFYPEAQLAFYDSMETLPGNTIYQGMVTQFYKAVTLLKLGQEKKAIEILKALVEKTKSSDQAQLAVDAKKWLALAYLRLGERNNCISNHEAGSCIFPIRGMGIYQDSGASISGISLFEELLRRDTSDLDSRWLLNLAYMTLGEYPRLVPPALLIPGLDQDTSSCQVKPFRDMAGDLGLNSNRNMAGSVIIDDFNNDGYLDIVTSAWGLDESMHYYRNNADGSFSDLSKESGLSNIKGGLNIIQADYNNDGYTDILVLRGAWLREFGKQPKTLLRNNGDGTFTDVTLESGILSFHPTQTAVWADFNNDGYLDLFIGNETTDFNDPQPSELYINNKNGTFTNVAKESGCQQFAFMKGVTAGDYNNDGWPDIFISTLQGRRILLKNKAVATRIPQFEDVSHASGIDKEVAGSFPTWFWDYDNDGWPDIFACGYQYQGSLAANAAAEALHQSLPTATSSMYLYKNNRDGTFTNVSKSLGLDRPVFAMGANFGDIDNDGWLDMYLGTGNPDFKSLIPNKMFKNIGGRRFADITSSARVGNLQKGHGVAFADIDNDGDQDIFIEVGGALPGDAFYNSFYINPGQNNNNWISLLLEGTVTNRSAIGAKIAISFEEDGKERTVFREVNSGGSFGSSPLRKEIGIGKASMIDAISITWPTTGEIQVFKNIPPCQFLRIKEGSKKLEKMNLRVLQFKEGNQSMPMKMKMLSCAPLR
jgi:tetratricopeptide (TPR) repeat protein